MNRTYRVALICGVLPLLAVASISLLWLIPRWNCLISHLAISRARFCSVAFLTRELPTATAFEWNGVNGAETFRVRQRPHRQPVRFRAGPATRERAS